ncbi:PAS domain-containing protein (plasmid) [Streptomyces sp. NBC_00028]|uniref:sensor histidine kinase n=1 Tax=Streptomyces sp. NBC_00028 TaxID=2975624 RepID=UPI002F9112AF
MTSIAGDWGSVFDVVRQPVWAVDATHTVRYANPAAAEALGHGDPSELLGYDGRPGPAPDHASRGEGALTRADGTLLPVEWTRLPLPPASGDATLTLYLFQPLDERTPGDRAPQPPGAPLRLLAHRQAARERQYAGTLQYDVQERLVRALLGLNMARQELGATSSPGAELLHGAVRDTEEALAGVREVTDALCPGALRAGGLPAALAALARRHPGQVTVTGTLTGRLPQLIETHGYLLVAEAVARALDHADAHHVQVTANHGPELVITVADDGTQPATATDLATLAALTERATSLDGTLTTRHTPDTGTTLTANIPLGPTQGP